MRSSEEQLGEILRRTACVKKIRAARRRFGVSTVSACACLALLVLTALRLPRLSQAAGQSATPRYGSLILTAPHFGYVAVGVLSFLLGVCVVLLFLRWREWKREERHGD